MNTRIFKTLMTGTAVGLFMAATPAMAQSNAELLKELKALKNKVAVLESKVAENEKNVEEKGDPGFKIKWDPAPSIQSSDGRFEMNIRGRIMADAVWFKDNYSNLDNKTTEFRRARLGIEGKAWNNVKYKFEIDFAGNSVAITDAYIQIKGGGIKWTFGQQKQTFSLDEMTSSRYISVMERAAFTDAFGLARQLGVTAGVGGDNWTLAVGAFRGNANGATNMDMGSAFSARATFSPKLGNSDAQLHIGAAVLHRRQGDDQSDVRYRQRPFVHATSKRFVATDRYFRKDTLFGVELAAVVKRFHVAGEYTFVKASINPSDFNASEKADFNGGYAEVGFFLTDDKRKYDPKKGSFGRVSPSKPMFKGGSGAVQIVYRYDMVDLTDTFSLNGGGTGTISGGKQTSHIIGINWHWNKYVRWMLNYSLTNVTGSLDAAAGMNDAFGNNKINAFSIRTQVDW